MIWRYKIYIKLYYFHVRSDQLQIHTPYIQSVLIIEVLNGGPSFDL